MDIPVITYRPSIRPTVKEIDSVEQFARQMYKLAIEDLGSLDRIDITYKSWIIRGKDGQKIFQRKWFGFP